jgi:hypothetical protein
MGSQGTKSQRVKECHTLLKKSQQTLRLCVRKNEDVKREGIEQEEGRGKSKDRRCGERDFLGENTSFAQHKSRGRGLSFCGWGCMTARSTNHSPDKVFPPVFDDFPGCLTHWLGRPRRRPSASSDEPSAFLFWDIPFCPAKNVAFACCWEFSTVQYYTALYSSNGWLKILDELR